MSVKPLIAPKFDRSWVKIYARLSYYNRCSSNRDSGVRTMFAILNKRHTLSTYVIGRRRKKRFVSIRIGTPVRQGRTE